MVFRWSTVASSVRLLTVDSTCEVSCFSLLGMSSVVFPTDFVNSYLDLLSDGIRGLHYNSAVFRENSDPVRKS